MTFYLFLLILTLIILHIWTRYRRLGRLIDKIPGPKALPIIGNLYSFNIPPKKIWIMMHEWQIKYPIFKIWSGIVPMVFTRNPDHIKVFMLSKKNINKEVKSYTNIKTFGNDGIVVSVGEIWKSHRKMLNQAFMPNMLEIYSKKIVACSKKLITKLLSHEKSFVHDVSQMLTDFAFVVGFDAVMDYELNSEIEEKGKIMQDAINVVNAGCYYRIFHPYIQDWMMKLLPFGRQQQQGWKRGENIIAEFTEERQKYLENNDKTRETRKCLSVLDVMLLHEQKSLIKRKDVIDEAILMIVASYKTTAVALKFLTLSLAEYKEVQDLARQELLNVVGGYNNSITVEHIKKLDYLERCAKETMRLYTVIPYIARSVDEEVKLGEYAIPIGTEVYFNVFQLHRDPDFWPDPLKFDPDRFLPENSKNRHPFAYLPFAKGPRNCIGQKLAMIEIKMVIAHIIYNFYLEPVDLSADFDLHGAITLELDGARVKFSRIQ